MDPEQSEELQFVGEFSTKEDLRVTNLPVGVGDIQSLRKNLDQMRYSFSRSSLLGIEKQVKTIVEARVVFTEGITFAADADGLHHACIPKLTKNLS